MRKIKLRIKEIAREKGLSMTKLHNRSEVSYTVIRKIFRDPYAEINLTTLARLSEILGVPSRDLIEDDDNHPSADE
ncbi:XRE family transcriptional regulator [Ktedonosporobacter rubrisoli]|uniref:XRE family transcriptional regulator n=1 Tax=Ktedonosporobacter rubrisoli TaxID=2509675 RepID=A0A4P6JXW6_KTERU|nr:helix-turn-helix transcriptional regulator [Ktedonosporobacter rubrisoli]QBD80283.1 XRE family transcriptional regulator [Ktedonosporobacter rubrisoli]